jgi:hypothetical protein
MGRELRAMASNVTTGKLYGCDEAAELLGQKSGETIRRWYRSGEVLEPGTEIVKIGGRIVVDVEAVRARLAKEQAQPRKV